MVMVVGAFTVMDSIGSISNIFICDLHDWQKQQNKMKKFTTEEIIDLLNQVYREEICFSIMVDILNDMVNEAEEPNFKEGDFLHSDWDDENITIIFKNQAGDNLYYHASKSCCLGVAVDNDRYWRDGGDFRIATESEKQELLDALAKEGKRWNEEKKCIEDIPKRKFQKGDKVRIKDGVSSKTHRNISPTFLEEMDELIGTTMTVNGYTHENVYALCKKTGWWFHKDWLEPYTDELKEGDLAIFWDNEKEIAIIKPYGRSDGGEEDYFQHSDQNEFRWRNAIKFESMEQFNRFIKGEI